MSALGQGISLGLAMIVQIGAQNAFVLKQGIHRQHHLMVALICVLCDIDLLAFGMFGSGVVIEHRPGLLQFVTAGGLLFLAVYASLSLRSARH
ncbi:LysE family transporter [Plesiomonas shigelloides]|uniref:LysE family transporter n=1 Tax=Plesiomonas shigelloides TaxID=703 RepID=A0A8I2B7A2_PLESH|nr:LysE family transporter [Plesiomonas shigelloides]MBO1109992.1 LysE family transporter [Plesiomonas shigelloides]